MIYGNLNNLGNLTIYPKVIAKALEYLIKNVENEQFIKMNPNDFFVFYPWDIHRPGCTDEIPTYTKKVVVKLNKKYIS